MKNTNKILNTVKVVVLALILTVGVQFVAAQSTTTWQPPTSSPPQGNTYAPLNVGPSGQVKDGGLTLGYTLSASAPALIIKNGKLCLPQGTGTLPPEGDCRSSWPTGGSGSGINCTGNCTAGFIPFFYDSNQITRSAVRQVGVGANAQIGISNANDPTTFTPGASLDVQGNVRIRENRGGSISVGSVLTATDSNGTASWKQLTPVNSQCTWTTATPGDQAQDLVCASGRVLTGVRLLDSDEGTNTAYRVKAIRCCPLGTQ